MPFAPGWGGCYQARLISWPENYKEMQSLGELWVQEPSKGAMPGRVWPSALPAPVRTLPPCFASSYAASSLSVPPSPFSLPLGHPCPSVLPPLSPQSPLISAPLSAPPSPLPASAKPTQRLGSSCTVQHGPGPHACPGPSHLCFPESLENSFPFSSVETWVDVFKRNLLGSKGKTNPNKAAHHLETALVTKVGPSALTVLGLGCREPLLGRRGVCLAIFPIELGPACLSQASLAPKPFLIGTPPALSKVPVQSWDSRNSCSPV